MQWDDLDFRWLKALVPSALIVFVKLSVVNSDNMRICILQPGPEQPSNSRLTRVSVSFEPF